MESIILILVVCVAVALSVLAGDVAKNKNDINDINDRIK